jgi:D-alanyl-D-alanine carboxypeptidase
MAALLGCGVPRYAPSRAPSHSSTFDAATTQALLRAAGDEVDAAGVPALLVHVEARDGRAFSGAVGTRDLRRRDEARLGDRIRMGSVTKILTAVVAVRLAERGVLSLEERLSRWLPDLPRAGEITIAELLSHRAGLPDVLGIGSVVHATIFTEHVYARDELLAEVAGGAFTDPPGARFRYSNGNYIVLGAALEEAAGSSMRALIDAEVLVPSGVHDTYLAPDEGRPPARLLVGYDRALVPFGHDVLPADTSFASLAWTSGALVSTASDIAAILRGVRDATLVSEASRSAMLPRWPAEGEHDERAVGLGLFRFDLRGRSHVGHAGLFIGSQALAVWDEADGTIVVVAGNRSSFDVNRVAARLGDIARGEGAR